VSLSLSCPCGARFDVEETFAGQEISCPECHEPIAAPARGQQPVRTSGFAVASVVLSLIGAFTLVLTLAAVVLGAVALVSISKNRGRVTGAGYAVFGIVAGAVFSGLFLFAILMPEVFGEGLLRGGLIGMQTDRSGSLEVVRKADGFAMTRPTPHWGVARARLQQQVAPESKLLLVQSARNAYIEVYTDGLCGRTVEQYREQEVQAFQGAWFAGGGRARLTNFSLRHSKRLEPKQGMEVHEVFFDVRLDNMPMTFLIEIIGPTRDDGVFLLRGWAPRRSFPRSEAEIRAALDSFQYLDE